MGPLKGLKIIEVSAIGPGPFCGMMLEDMGADVVCIDRGGETVLEPQTDCARRGKRSIMLDLKSPDGRELFMRLIEKADAVFDTVVFVTGSWCCQRTPFRRCRVSSFGLLCPCFWLRGLADRLRSGTGRVDSDRQAGVDPFHRK